MVESRCGILCGACEYRDKMHCGGCVHIDKPFWGDACPVKSCCESKGLEHCGTCRDFPCDLLGQFAYDKEQGDEGKRIEQCRDWAMCTVYVYVLDTLADWEPGYVMAELNSGRFFRKGAPRVSLQTVGTSKDPIHTMGGMTIVPDCIVHDMVVRETNVLLLPGADTWNDPKHGAILEKASEFLSIGATVGAICGATAALAGFGLLDERPHTSNGPGFLEMVSPGYKGQSFYVDKPSVADTNLITASATGALLWAKQIIEHLGVFGPDTLASWYAYFHTGEPEHFFALMQSLPSNDEN